MRCAASSSILVDRRESDCHFSFAGKMDDLRIYNNRALSAADVSLLYRGGIACGYPTGVEGDAIYNATSQVPQYCDGVRWNAMQGGIRAVQ